MPPARAPRKKPTGETPQGTVPPVPPVPEDEAPRPRASGTRAPRTPVLQKKLEELFASPALLYSFAGDEYAAALLAQRTPAMAEAWYNLAQQNAGVKRMLERLTEGSAWGGVVLSSAAVVLPLLQHHGVLPGVDPFTAILGHPTPAARGPIVPPPPAPEGHAPAPGGAENAGGGGTMAPPIADGAPAGTVTVAALQAIGAHNGVDNSQ